MPALAQDGRGVHGKRSTESRELNFRQVLPHFSWQTGKTERNLLLTHTNESTGSFSTVRLLIDEERWGVELEQFVCQKVCCALEIIRKLSIFLPQLEL